MKEEVKADTLLGVFVKGNAELIPKAFADRDLMWDGLQRIADYINRKPPPKETGDCFENFAGCTCRRIFERAI